MMRSEPMIEHAQELIGTVITAILGILWWDIRTIRTERGRLKEDILKEVGRRVNDKNGGMLTADKHNDLCRIATLEQNEFLLEKFSDMLDDKFKKNGFVRVP